MIKILALNINSPSLDRAKLQGTRLLQESADVVVLTEIKQSAGGMHLVSNLETAGYRVCGWPTRDYAGYMTVIGSRVPFRRRCAEDTPSRICEVELLADTPFCLAGVYGPSTDPLGRSQIDKVETKKKWLSELLESSNERIKSDLPYVMIGDLNIVDDRDFPQYRRLYDFERNSYLDLRGQGLVDVLYEPPSFTWMSNQGSGYRYDHVLMDESSAAHLSKAEYIDDWRLGSQRLTDHSGIFVEFDINYHSESQPSPPMGSQISLF